MRAVVAVLISCLTLTPAVAIAQPVKQSVKYTLLIFVGGAADGARADGAAMRGTGIYMSREDCEAAGSAVTVGVVNQIEGQRPPAIFWICVPLGRP